MRNSSRNGVRRSDITLSIGSWNDIDRAQKTLLAIAIAKRRVKREPAPIAFLATLGESTVSIALRYWASSADFFATQTDLTKRAKAGIRLGRHIDPAAAARSGAAGGPPAMIR